LPQLLPFAPRFVLFPSVVLTFQPCKPQIRHAFKRFSHDKLINNSLRTSWAEEECEHDMLVLIRWKPHELAVPLRQLEGSHVDEQTQQAIEDWHYWVNQGYAL
jgi:hypothetical protein